MTEPHKKQIANWKRVRPEPQGVNLDQYITLGEAYDEYKKFLNIWRIGNVPKNAVPPTFGSFIESVKKRGYRVA